jgi:hypothetical protein
MVCIGVEDQVEVQVLVGLVGAEDLGLSRIFTERISAGVTTGVKVLPPVAGGKDLSRYKEKVSNTSTSRFVLVCEV